LILCLKEIHPKETAYTASDDIRIIKICSGIRDNKSIYPKSLAAAQNRSQIPWFFYAFQHDDGGIFFWFKIIQ